jgi:hypothetical protein
VNRWDTERNLSGSFVVDRMVCEGAEGAKRKEHARPGIHGGCGVFMHPNRLIHSEGAVMLVMAEKEPNSNSYRQDSKSY